jgi:hypothetical protein
MQHLVSDENKQELNSLNTILNNARHFCETYADIDCELKNRC